jgi:hypothetical protein
MLFSRKPKPVNCSVCGQAIAPKERRYVDKNVLTRATRHTHVACQEAARRAKL